MPVIKPKSAIKPIKPIKSKRFYNPVRKKEERPETIRKNKIKKAILKSTKTNNKTKTVTDKYEISSLPMVPKPIEGVELQTGNVYYFKYDPATLDLYPRPEERANHIPFWDRNPLFLMFDYRIINGKPCLFGVNLHFLPDEEKEDFIRYIMEEIGDMKKVTWTLVQDALGGRFKYLPIAFRQYRITRVSNIVKAMDVHMQTDIDFNEKFNEMLSDFRAKFKMETTQATLSMADLDRMVRIAKSGKSWYKYVYDTFIRKK
jgi:hypothetical protein